MANTSIFIDGFRVIKSINGIYYIPAGEEIRAIESGKRLDLLKVKRFISNFKKID